MQPVRAAITVGIIATAAMIALAPVASDAALISKTYEIKATGFAPLSGATPAPVDPAHISVTVTFDNAADIPDQIAGITLNSSDLALGSPLGFRYLKASDALIVGGMQDQVGGLLGNTDDWTVLFGLASTDNPFLGIMIYRISSVAAGWSTFDGAVEAAAVAVPEPSALAMIPFGLLAAGLLAWRERRASGRPDLSAGFTNVA